MGLKIYSEQFRDEVLKLNLKTPPDIVSGLVDLSGAALYASYQYALGEDAVIHSTNVINPGTVDTGTIITRNKLFNKNLKTPKDITEGIGETTDNQGLTQQYLAGRGTKAIINDYNVINPGDVEKDSVLPRKKNFAKNLQTPNDITSNIFAGYLSGRGEKITINDYNVTDPGTIDDQASIQRNKAFSRNKPLSGEDPSESNAFVLGGSYTFSSLLATIGELTTINDLRIPNLKSVSEESNMSSEVFLNLTLQSNKYIPVETNKYEATVLKLQNNQNPQPYIQAYNSGVFDQLGAGEYEPSQFLSMRSSVSPISILTNTTTDPVAALMNAGKKPLEGETLLMNIAALELKFNFETRIKRNIEKETLGRTRIDEAFTNPLTAMNLLKDPSSWFEKSYEITVSSNPIGKAAEFAASLVGFQSPLSFIPDIREDYTPSCFGNTTNYDGGAKTALGRFLDDLLGKTAARDRDVYYLNHTGTGQKYSLFSNIKKNKYSPDYLADYQSGVFKLGDKIADELRGITGFLGIGAGQRPGGRYYIGNKSKNEDPFYLLQDADGDQVKSNEELVKSISTGLDGQIFEEPGYDQVSHYGSLETDFIWKSQNGADTVLNPKNKISEKVNGVKNIKDTNILSFNKYNTDKFRECSILFKTSQLLEKGMNNYPSPIDQTLTKFYDGYSFHSRGNSVIAPVVVERLNKKGEKIGYRYLVPGLDAAGRRNDEKMYVEAEMCRTWTKNRPYSKISHLVRYKELIRKERNSVLDRYGNLNIHPSQLNVNTGYGSGDITTEAFGQRRARKYMFSLENLAWRDSTQFDNLPDCEKGFNGGRIMWFPPYDIQFTDDTSMNLTTHQFLGRPEPIYTYNNTERTGTLNWKIVVDHPSILNLLVQKELASLTDGEVDELLSAFWSGCLEFDVFDLARIWGVFSQNDIDYFKRVLADVNLSTPNDRLKQKLEQASPVKNSQQANISDINVSVPKSKINGYNLFFENDVPLDPGVYNQESSVYNTGKIESFDKLFEQYKKLAITQGLTDNADAAKNLVRSDDIDPELIDYYTTIGSGSYDQYFISNSIDSKWFGYEKQFDDIHKDLKDEKYVGFDLTIGLKSYASPLAPNQNPDAYNSALAQRRFVSVVKWLCLSVLNTVGKVYTDKGTEITQTNIDEVMGGVTKSIVILRDSKTDDRDKITINLETASGIPVDEAMKPFASKKAGDNSYFETVISSNGTPITYYCFASSEIADKVVNDSLLPDAEPDQIGTINAKKSRSNADVVCSVLSAPSSYARRVEVNVEVSKRDPKAKPKAEAPLEATTVVTEEPASSTNLTKRDIAQRIINKLVTECDYFELLSKEAPIVYDSLKQKLKYFSPAFHAMTPEGLNARLTFLQQCLRPGDTIKRSNGDTCDATNTSFGKPPVCVLRIGDFYNTKIIINNLNITYDPLVWDLNPEGIGVQPMIATISVSFKYIGGSGLRKHVDELQNALSFNYYANTDVYDDRTFANTDQRERALVNMETSFFDGGQLDLIPIIQNAEKITYEQTTGDIPSGTVGHVVKKMELMSPGGQYAANIQNATVFNSNTLYKQFDVVSYDGKFYVRKADNEKMPGTPNQLTGVDPTNTKYWVEYQWRNYGETALNLEFASETSKKYYYRYEISYQDIFKSLYNSYGEVITNVHKVNVPKNANTTLLSLLINKNYNKRLTSIQDNAALVLDDIKDLPFQDDSLGTPATTGSTLNPYNIFRNEANERNYVEFKDFTKLVADEVDLSQEKVQSMRLHLYPQEYMYKIGNGLELGYPSNNDSNRYNPGLMSGGYYNGTPNNSEVGGIFLKDYSNYEENVVTLIGLLRSEMETKIKYNLNHFWHINAQAKNVFTKYITSFDNEHKKVLQTYLLTKLNNFVSNFTTELGDKVNRIKTNTAKVGTLLTGLSVVSEGYEMKFDGNTISTYEVIPNEFKLSSDPTDLFGYEPYNVYRPLNFGGRPIKFIDIHDIYVNKNNSYEDFMKFLSLGNGNYFFKQISRETKFKDLALLGYTGTTGYTITNKLPESTVFKTGTNLGSPTAPNFTVVTGGVIINAALNQNAQAGTTTVQNITPNTFTEYYKMKYTFEKLNYELFDFTNKTLDVMLNDKYQNPNFDVDIRYLNDHNFTTLLTNLQSNLPIEMKYKLFQKGLKTNGNLDLNYYYYDTDNYNGSETEDILVTINDFKDYTFTISRELIVDTPVNQSSAEFEPAYQGEWVLPTGVTSYDVNDIVKYCVNDVCYYYSLDSEFADFAESQLLPAEEDSPWSVYIDINNPLKQIIEPSEETPEIMLSGLIDLIFMEFMSDITDSDKAGLLSSILAITPQKNISGTDKVKAKLIDKRKKDIEKILNDIFNLINTYKETASDLVGDLYNLYTEQVSNVLDGMSRIISKNPSTSIELTPSSVENALMKGSSADDYTLVFREATTNNVKDNAKQNFSVFTKYRERFNIIANNTTPTEVESSGGTELDKYLKGL